MEQDEIEERINVLLVAQDVLNRVILSTRYHVNLGGSDIRLRQHEKSLFAVESELAELQSKYKGGLNEAV